MPEILELIFFSWAILEALLLTAFFLWRFSIRKHFEMLAGAFVFLTTAMRFASTYFLEHFPQWETEASIIIWGSAAWTACAALLIIQSFLMGTYRQTALYKQIRVAGGLFWISYSFFALTITYDSRLIDIFLVFLVLGSLFHLLVFLIISREMKMSPNPPEETSGRILFVVGAFAWPTGETLGYLLSWPMEIKYLLIGIGLFCILLSVQSFAQRSYSTFFHQINLSAFVIDRNLRIKEANSHLTKTFNLPKKTFINLSLLDFLAIMKIEEIQERISEVFEFDKAVSFPLVRAQWPPGSGDRIISLHFIPVSYHFTRHVKEIGAIIADVTETVERLEEIEQMKSDFITTTSHELRTPLTVIKGYLELFESDIESFPERHKPAISSLIQNVERLERMIRDVHSISVLEAKPIERVEPVNVFAILLNAVGEAQDIAKDGKTIHIGMKTLESNCIINSTPEDMNQLIWILLDNALKYTQTEGIIEVELETNDSDLVLKIKDNGVGIQTDDLARIFDRFYKGKSEILTDGSGLGLAIARMIVERLKGEIKVHSEGPGLGAVFTVILPRTNILAAYYPQIL